MPFLLRFISNGMEEFVGFFNLLFVRPVCFISIMIGWELKVQHLTVLRNNFFSEQNMHIFEVPSIDQYTVGYLCLTQANN